MLDVDRLRDAMQRQTGVGFELVEAGRRLAGGLSGASVQLLHVQEEGSFGFAVAKVASPDRLQDLTREQRGYELMCSSWPSEVLPRRHLLLETEGLVRGQGRHPVLVASFADERRTKIRTLLELFRADAAAGAHALDVLVAAHATQAEADGPGSKALPLQLARQMVDATLLERILGFPWHHFGIDADKPCVLLAGRSRINPVHALRHAERYQTPNTPYLRAPMVPIHGDLNPRNVLCPAPDRFVLIDFEKARQGTPHYDLAFLFMWLLQDLVLDALDPTVPALEAELLEHCGRMAQCFGAGSATVGPLGGRFASLAPLADHLLLKLRCLTSTGEPSRLLPEELQCGTGGLAIAMAALVRAYYELRDLTRADPALAQRPRLAGTVFFSIATLFFEQAADVQLRPADAGQLFVFPPSQRPARPTEQPAPAAPIRIECATRPGASRWLRLSWLRTLAPDPRSPLAPPGWTRIVNVDQWSYFSKLGMRTPAALQAETETLLRWLPAGEAALPAIFELDLNLLGGALLLDPAAQPLRLRRIDLVPLPREDRVALSLLLSGGPCTVSEHLTAAGARTYGSHQLHQRHERSGEPHITIGGLIAELCAALEEARMPSRAAMQAKVSLGDQPFVFQYLLSPEEQDWAELVSSAGFEAAWRAVATLARASAHTPKGDAGELQHWTHPEAPRTRFGLHRRAITVWASAATQFNRDTKPHIVHEALYFQWLLARELAQSGATGEAILYAHRETVRRKFFSACLARYGETGW